LSFRFKDFEIDVARQELRRDGAVVHIEPQVFDLLVHLVRNRDRIVSKDELIDTIWQGRIVSEATLSSRISSARRALGDTGNDQNLIRTLHRRGFRFVGDVEVDRSTAAGIAIEDGPPPESASHDAAKLVPADEPRPLADDPSIDPGADPAPVEHGAVATKRHSARNLVFAVAAIGFASLLVTAGWLLPLSPSPAPTPARAAEAPADRLTSLAPSIIVLPFTNFSSDAKQDYVADGIADSLISDLAHGLPGISIVSRDTAFTYKGRVVDARQIGRELEARYLLEGSVQIEGERVRVNARLVETEQGNQLWAERFDAERTSILQVQDEIVGRVSRAIGLQVVDLEARRSLRERPSSAELIDLVMRGKAALNRPSSPATMTEARAFFEQALQVDPTSADALAGVASTLVFEFLNGYYEADGEERLRRAELLLDRATAIEPCHLMALKAKAALRRAQGKFDDAIATAEAVLAENPGEPWAYKEIGLSTLYLGRPEQAIDWFAKADRIGPRDPGRWTWLDGRGHALILLGRDEEAIPALMGALDANPRNRSSHAFLAAAYGLLGRSDQARAALATYLERRPDTRLSTFRRLSPVPLALTSSRYQQQHERLKTGLRIAGMPE
jgi:TolB-like protein/DNA-binding winged helix-turn-helix (wHTH) protein/cytochrome c-type biogenesis protein CcmH/NrfG